MGSAFLDLAHLHILGISFRFSFRTTVSTLMVAVLEGYPAENNNSSEDIILSKEPGL
jgi:hypothetical protein